jgi:hypothetical protein
MSARLAGLTIAAKPGEARATITGSVIPRMDSVRVGHP